jgi:hypothetical protein
MFGKRYKYSSNNSKKFIFTTEVISEILIKKIIEAMKNSVKNSEEKTPLKLLSR